MDATIVMSSIGFWSAVLKALLVFPPSPSKLQKTDATKREAVWLRDGILIG